MIEEVRLDRGARRRLIAARTVSRSASPSSVRTDCSGPFAARRPRRTRWPASMLLAVLTGFTLGDRIHAAEVDPATAVSTRTVDRPAGKSPQADVELMPTPVGFERGGADLFDETVPAERTTKVQVFAASNRAVDPAAPPGGYLTDRRSLVVRLCSLEVELGRPGQTWQSFADAAREPGRTEGPPMALASLTDFGGVWPGPRELEPRAELGAEAIDRFAGAIDAALDRSGGEVLYVYVHGFDTTVAKNAAYAAEVFSYLGRRGAIVLFEWPSQASVIDYAEDKTAARASVRTFRKFLELLSKRTQAKRIHILAHSAGAPIALMAIDELRLLHHPIPAREAGRLLRLGRLLLVAPDMDFFEAFDALADGATDLPERVTVYDNRGDRALALAQWISGSTRLGNSLDRLDPGDLRYLRWHGNVDVVEVGNAERHAGSWLGHRYFWKDPWVSTDLLLTLATDATPAERCLVFDPKRLVSGFGDDYPARIRAAAPLLTAAPDDADSAAEDLDGPTGVVDPPSSP